MKYLQYVLITIALTIVSSCTKKPDGIITITTKIVSDITENSAKCGGSVSYTGGFTIEECGICYSEDSYPTITDFYTEDHYGVGSFNSTLSDLESGTKYYVRAYARTSSGIKYGDQESFTTEDNWLHYGDNVYNNSWGLISGGNDEWAVMFPSNMLSPYNGKYISKVKVYFKETGVYTLKIYQGGYSEPSTMLMSQAYNISNTGWVTISNFTALSLNTSKTLWVSISYSYEAGTYPKCSSTGINEPNARWSHRNNGDWYDTYDNNQNRDLCWLIQVLLSDSTKGENEIELGYCNPIPCNEYMGASRERYDIDLRHDCNE